MAIYGVGGVGHLAVQFAKLNGAEVYAVDVGEEKLKTAERHARYRLRHGLPNFSSSTYRRATLRLGSDVKELK